MPTTSSPDKIIIADSSPCHGPETAVFGDDPRLDHPQDPTLTSHDKQATRPDDPTQDSPKKTTYNPRHGPKLPLRKIRQILVEQLKAGRMYQFPPFQISKKRKINATMSLKIHVPQTQQQY